MINPPDCYRHKEVPLEVFLSVLMIFQMNDLQYQSLYQEQPISQ